MADVSVFLRGTLDGGRRVGCRTPDMRWACNLPFPPHKPGIEKLYRITNYLEN